MDTEAAGTEAAGTEVVSYADRPWQMLVGGELRPGLTGATMPVVHPGDESVIARIPLGSAADVDGLTASVWTTSLHTAMAAVRDLQAGYVWVNWSSEHIAGSPFGGVKNSGLGREESLEEIESYTQHKNVCIKF